MRKHIAGITKINPVFIQFFLGGIQGYVLVIKISVAKQEMLRMLIGGKWRSNVQLLHRSLFKTSVKSVTAVMD